MLGLAILAVRGAMQARRERAESAFVEARECLLSGLREPSSARPAAFRGCRESARNAGELSLELPERGVRQLELRAALEELDQALESGDERRLVSAFERSTRAGKALGWPIVHTELH